MGFHEKWTTILNHMNGLSLGPPSLSFSSLPPCSCMSSRFEVVFRAKVVPMPWESACPSQKGKEKERKGERGYLEGNLHVRQKANATIPLEAGGLRTILRVSESGDPRGSVSLPEFVWTCQRQRILCAVA